MTTTQKIVTNRPGRRGKAGQIRTVGYGFVGRWADGDLGWALPDHLDGVGIEPPADRDYTRQPADRPRRQQDRAYLCKITVEQVLDKQGRPIVRKFPVKR